MGAGRGDVIGRKNNNIKAQSLGGKSVAHLILGEVWYDWSAESESK